MSRSYLSNRVGAGYDPCGAIHVPFTLAAGQEKEIQFMLGTAGRRSADASQYVHRYRSVEAAELALVQVQKYWEKTLSAVTIQTPDTSLNVLANGWLMYQTIGCRLWARSGFYQSGGAFGFRDQLQDAMSVIHTEPRCSGTRFFFVANTSSSRAMSSTGGIRRQDEECEPAVRTIISGCRLALPLHHDNRRHEHSRRETLLP